MPKTPQHSKGAASQRVNQGTKPLTHTGGLAILTSLSDGLESRLCPMYDASRLIDPRNSTSPESWCPPLWKGILTALGAQRTLSRHYWVDIRHGGVLGVHESLWVRDRF